MEQLIYTDQNRAEQGYLKNFILDLETGTDDDFELTVPLADFKKLSAGCLVIPENMPELGGVITGVKIKTQAQEARFYGLTWLGFLKNVAFARGSKNIVPNGGFASGQSGWSIVTQQQGDSFSFADGVFRFRSTNAIGGERKIESDYIAVNPDSDYQFGWSARMAASTNSEPVGMEITRYDADKNQLQDKITLSNKYPETDWQTWAYGSSTLQTIGASYIKILLKFHHTANNTTDFYFDNLFVAEEYEPPQTIKELLQRAIRDCTDFVNEGQSVPIDYVPMVESYSSYDVLQDFCRKNGYKIKLSYRHKIEIDGVEYYGKIGIDLVQVADYSGDEYVSSLVDMEITDNARFVNHAIGVDGIGEPTYTVIAERYMRRDGVIDNGDGAPELYYRGKDMISTIVPCSDNFVIPALDSVLYNARANAKSIVITVDNLNADVGDIVGGFDPVSGLSAATTIKSKNLKMTQYNSEITFET